MIKKKLSFPALCEFMPNVSLTVTRLPHGGTPR